MAPIATEALPSIQDLKIAPTAPAASPAQKLQWFSETGRPQSDYPYAHLLPSGDKTNNYTKLGDFTHVDPGLKALDDPTPRSFLDGSNIDLLTPEFGSEVEGIQLHQLDDRGRQQLALYVAQRGVVAFRDQGFIDQDPEWHVRNWGSFFGRNHIHPTSGQPKNFPELHLVYREWGNDNSSDYYLANRISSVGWHSDVTYEKQPPGLTALFLYDSPVSGGDTTFVDQRSAYKRLSPSFQAYLETLSVLHSGVDQANFSRERGEKNAEAKAYGHVRRDPVENIHPLVRRHPVTGEKALFINRVFSRHIVGLKLEESAALLEFLYTTIERGADFQVRLRWRPRTVVLWDNRITAHSALVDFDNVPGSRRHGARITPQAEVPTL